MGYELDIKKAKMKSRFAKKWVSLKTLSDTFGEDCMPSDFEFFYEKNEMDYEEGRPIAMKKSVSTTFLNVAIS